MTGFVNGQTLADATTGTLSFTTTATVASNVGTYAIDGSGLTADNGNYVFVQAAGNATELTVNPATLTITASGASQTYGGATPTLTGTVTGFVNDQTLADATTGTLSFTTTANVASNVGTYAIDGSGLTLDNGNYVFVQAAGNATALTVNPATLTITASGASQTYGGATPTLTGTVSGFVNGQTLADAATGTLSFTTTATDTSNVGTYAIDDSGLTADNGNYVFAQAAGNATALTVDPATLTITAGSQTKTYGQTDDVGADGYTVDGLVNGDTVTGVTLASTGAAASAGAGSYAITASDAFGTDLSNYAITYVNGTLTVLASTPSPAAGSITPALLTVWPTEAIGGAGFGALPAIIDDTDATGFATVGNDVVAVSAGLPLAAGAEQAGDGTNPYRHFRIDLPQAPTAVLGESF